MKVLDLFAGAGGLSAGLRESTLDVELVRAVELDIDAAATYEANEPGVVFQGSVDEWLRSEAVPNADLVVGGPPCQGFSALGKQDSTDERNGLWRDYARALAKAGPKYFVMENVPQFLGSIQYQQLVDSTRRGSTLQDYVFEATVVNAADFGVAQNRRRAILIGHHRDVAAPGAPVHVGESRRTVKDVLSGVDPYVTETDLPSRSFRFGSRDLKGSFSTHELHVTRQFEPISIARFEAIPRGGNRFDLPEELKAPCWRRHTTGSGDVMGRLHWDKPSVTIRTEFFKPEKGRYLHPDENRSITHMEAALIQGFSRDFQWVGSKTSIGRQIGNAVPVPLGRAIGEVLAAAT